MKNATLLSNVFLLCCLFWGVASGSVGEAAQAHPAAKTYVIPPGPNDQYELQKRLIEAVPGDVIQLQSGVYRFQGELNVVTSHVTIRGRGHNETVLSFVGQQTGSEGLVATGDAFRLEDLAIEDTAGNAVKFLGVNGLVVKGVRVEWTDGPKSTNGAYGIYPVQCENVLIEESIAIGAADAGIYVGQSKNVIVRNCRAELNVAGIEIENTLNADVYKNVATRNTGGLLVFDLPGLQITNGGNVRLYDNQIFKNNTENFAPPGNMVAEVPPGTGVMVMATDRVEIFENTIADNQTANISIVSFQITERPINDLNYDPVPEGIHIHHNKFSGGGTVPSGKLGKQLSLFLPKPFPDVLYDGVINPARLKDGKLPEKYQIRFSDNGEMSFVNFQLPMMNLKNISTGKYRPVTDLAAYQGQLKSLKPTTLAKFPPVNQELPTAVSVYRSVPKKLSEWELFQGNGRSQEPAEGVIRYELNTPLFSDYTSKYRFIRLPEGESMTYEPDHVFRFPVGTVIAKTFSYPHDMRDPHNGERLLETRIEVHRESGWYGFSYVWNGDQTEAILELGGQSLDVKWIHHDGSTRSNRYAIPNANQCISCHSRNSKFVPLGPTARNLNRSGHGSSVNQLEAWSSSGKLAQKPPSEKIDRLPGFDDPQSGTVERRARAWLDVNCAHCHNPEGSARTSGLDLRMAQKEQARFGVMKTPVATGRGTGGRKYDIVPGKPEESILLYRLESAEPGVRMPNLARNLVHDESVELIREWIEQMPADHQPTSPQ